MEFFQRLKSVKAKHLLIGAAAVAVFGLGRLSRKPHINELKQDFARKEQGYKKQIEKLKVSSNTFRFFDYDANGVKITEIDRIKDAPMPEEFKDRFGKYRTREIAPAEIVRLDSIRHKMGEGGNENRNAERLKELELSLGDSIGAWGNEDYLKQVAEYRSLVMEEMRLFSKRKGNFDFRLFKMDDAQLREVVEEYPIVGYMKYMDEPYPEVGKLKGERKDAYLAQKILDMRSYVRVNNDVVEDMKRADSLLFEGDKEVKIERIKQEKANYEPAGLKPYMMKFRSFEK